jgi:hypothetical protein
MRFRRFHLYPLVALLLTVVGPAVFSQPNPGISGKFGQPDRASAHLMVWNLLAGGKDSINVNTMDFPPAIQLYGDRMRQGWSNFLQKKGITDGVMTRELYLEFTGHAPLTYFKGPSVLPPGLLPVPRPQASAPGENPNEENARVEDEGRRGPAPVEETRPAVYRVGKLPRELPGWFAQLDKDNDGQVGLYEWKAAGKATTEFLAMDANGDGFLTAEEVLRFQRVNKKTAKVGPPPFHSRQPGMKIPDGK